MELKAITRGFRFMETNFPEEIYTLPSDPPHMKGIEAVCMQNNVQENIFVGKIIANMGYSVVRRIFKDSNIQKFMIFKDSDVQKRKRFA